MTDITITKSAAVTTLADCLPGRLLLVRRSSRLARSRYWKGPLRRAVFYRDGTPLKEYTCLAWPLRPSGSDHRRRRKANAWRYLLRSRFFSEVRCCRPAFTSAHIPVVYQSMPIVHPLAKEQCVLQPSGSASSVFRPLCAVVVVVLPKLACHTIFASSLLSS